MVHENMILVGPFLKSEMGFMALDLKHLGLVRSITTHAGMVKSLFMAFQIDESLPRLHRFAGVCFVEVRLTSEVFHKLGRREIK